MPSIPIRKAALLAFGLLFFFSGRSHAQSLLGGTQMPAETVFYVSWRGTPAPEVRKSNSLLALWDDPDFAPTRAALVEAILSGSQEKSGKQELTRAEWEEYASLLDNPFVLGYVSEPQKRAKTIAAASDKAKSPAWNGIFLVYDRSGKEALLAKAVLRMRAQEKDAPRISKSMVGEIPVLVVQRKDGTTYWVEHGKYAVSASERSVMEGILGHLGEKSSSLPSLAQSSAYQEARPLLGEGLLEFFGRVPNLKELAGDSSAGGIGLAPVLDALKLGAIHAVGGRITLEGAKTRVRGALLGDAAPGTLFDLWPESQGSPALLALLPADVVSCNSMSISVLGLYGILRRAVSSAAPNGQSNVDMVEALAQARIGMPLRDALGLFSGEFALFQTNPSLDPEKRVFFGGIRNKPEILKLMRTVLSDRLSSERTEGDVTFLKVSLAGGQGTPGVAQWNFYHLAITPDAIFGAGRAESVRDFLPNRSQTAGVTKLVAVPTFQSLRAQLPDKVNSISYSDFQKIDWQGLKNRELEVSKKAARAKNDPEAQKAAAAKIPESLWSADPKVLSRHLHYSISGSWKDAHGIHFDGWIE